MNDKNYIVCHTVTDAARKVIEANGGKVEVLREAEPHLELVTIVDALYHGRHKEDGYFSYTLSRKDYGYDGDGSGICHWKDDTTVLRIYRWNGKEPDDPQLWSWEDEDTPGVSK